MSETDYDCNLTMAPLDWGAFSECDSLPLSYILLLAFSAIWGALFVVTAVRRTKHANSATKNLVVSKKLQHLQTWAYSFFHSLVGLSSVFAAASLLIIEEPIPAFAILGCEVFSALAASQVDAVGSIQKKPGTNKIDFSVALQHLVGLRLPKAVWKQSGHTELVTDSEEEAAMAKSRSKVSQFLCLNDLENHITPKVYDVKDVTGIQGAYLGLPSLAILAITFVRGNLITSEDEIITESFEMTNFDLTLQLAAGLAFLSAILPPLFGDWETHHKSKLKSLGSVFLRSVEVSGRISMYAFFIDETKFTALLMLACELTFMAVTNITANETSAGGRTGSNSHLLLSSWEATFFGNYRRLSVDKEFVTHSTQMPVTVEFIRFLGRTVANLTAYMTMIVGRDITLDFAAFEDLITAQSPETPVKALFYGGVAANLLVTVYYLGSFLIVKRKQMKVQDVKRIGAHWKTIPPLSWCCASKVVHINRDQNMGGINYI